jgi:hypothetical protein
MTSERDDHPITAAEMLAVMRQVRRERNRFIVATVTRIALYLSLPVIALVIAAALSNVPHVLQNPPQRDPRQAILPAIFLGAVAIYWGIEKYVCRRTNVARRNETAIARSSHD